MFSKALLEATYVGGKPGKLTEAHDKAEHHRFKKDYLYREKKIPQEYYVSRLIQHYLILKAVEAQLQSLPETQKEEISAFFALSYLGQLWRTPAIEADLRELGVNLEAIPDESIATATKTYVEEIKVMPPKALLTHFLVHVAGFMHGGQIIQSKYINPSF